LNGGSVEQLGVELPNQHRYIPIMPAFDENEIVGVVTYIDSYRNIITNISKELFDKVRNNRKYIISVKSTEYSMDRISKNYSDVEHGEMVAIFNSLGLLEIAQRSGYLAQLLDINTNSPVTVKFI
jgi:S-adenosylmethionine hydrolase